MRRHQGADLTARRTWIVAVARTFAITFTALLLGVATPARAQNGKRTTVILVRHGEKAAEPAADPPLTEAGRARAEALWMAVKDAGVRAVITTQLARTVQTAAPTATHLGITPEVVPAGGANHPVTVASAVKKHAGETVLVVGHSNTVTAIIAALGAKEPPAICDEVYDNLYIVTIDESGKSSLVHARYGASTPPSPSCGSMK